MDNVFWLVLRRLRTPLLVLIGAYAVSVGGLVLIPGVDGEGQPWRFDFLHAFYFVSYMGSTIGFGEIPHPFTPAQRLWVTLCIFLTVTAWLYAIGRIFALVQESSFRNAVAEARFVRAVRRISQPFWIICGYGETGKLLVRALVRRQVQVVLHASLSHLYLPISPLARCRSCCTPPATTRYPTPRSRPSPG